MNRPSANSENTLPNAASCPPGPIACACGDDENMGPASACRKRGKTSEMVQHAASPIPGAASFKTLINSGRLDKAGGDSAGNMPSKSPEKFFRSPVGTSPRHRAALPPSAAVRFQRSHPVSAGGPANIGIRGPTSK